MMAGIVAGAAVAGGGGGPGISYVGGVTYNHTAGAAGTRSLTSLSGGSDSAPSIGDVVVVVLATVASTAPTISMNTSGYTEEVSLSSIDNSGFRADFRVWYKRLTSADTSFNLTCNQQCAIAVLVLRGVDATTQIDVTTTTATGTNTGLADPPSITPATTGALVLSAGGGGYTPASVYTSSDLANFISTANTAAFVKPIVGAGTHAWTTGAFDPALFGGGTTSSNAAWAAASLAFRPA